MLNFKSFGLLISLTLGNTAASPAGKPLLNDFYVNTQFCDHFKINSISV